VYLDREEENLILKRYNYRLMISKITKEGVKGYSIRSDCKDAQYIFETS